MSFGLWAGWGPRTLKKLTAKMHRDPRTTQKTPANADALDDALQARRGMCYASRDKGLISHCNSFLNLRYNA